MELPHGTDTAAEASGETGVCLSSLVVGLLEELGRDHVAPDALRCLLAQTPQLRQHVLVELAARDALGHARLDRAIGARFLARPCIALVLAVRRCRALTALIPVAATAGVPALARGTVVPAGPVIAARAVVMSGAVVPARPVIAGAVLTRTEVLSIPALPRTIIATATRIRTATLGATTGAVLTRAELPILTRTRTTVITRTGTLAIPVLPRTIITTATRIRTTTLRATTGASLAGTSVILPATGRAGAAVAAGALGPGGAAVLTTGSALAPGVIGPRSPALIAGRRTGVRPRRSLVAPLAAPALVAVAAVAPVVAVLSHLDPSVSVVSRYAIFVQKPKRPTTVDPLVMR
ncbi:hypothetical protein H3H54_07160 [Brachybacterium sp. Z12]|uniref:hypothetical protein n=1 Tax=Brachybacterium sp. Z12 TaxID=2759167 RepID=UPI001861F606|nr:hypothetical protein [Brachybacterium sp. Z12]QNN83325.1 hypothetical protein H3H54_07160 [Brachybacterium sp. Z12]